MCTEVLMEVQESLSLAPFLRHVFDLFLSFLFVIRKTNGTQTNIDIENSVVAFEGVAVRY